MNSSSTEVEFLWLNCIQIVFEWPKSGCSSLDKFGIHLSKVVTFAARSGDEFNLHFWLAWEALLGALKAGAEA